VSAVPPWSAIDEPESAGDVASTPSEEKELVVGRVLSKVDAMLAQRATPPPPLSQVRPRSAPPPAAAAPPPAPARPTLRLPASAADPRPQGIRAAPAAGNDVTPPSPPAFPMPPVVRAPEALTRTAPAKDRPAGEWAQQGQLPFHAAPPRIPPSGRGIAGTLQLREMGLGTGRTATLGSTGIAQALAVLPFAASTAGVQSFRPLTVEQYASLRAELAVTPDRPGAILPRYGVYSEAARRALDACWEAYFAAQPAARAAFEADLARFTAWLRREGT
jgi:hypothetical protein